MTHEIWYIFACGYLIIIFLLISTAQVFPEYCLTSLINQTHTPTHTRTHVAKIFQTTTFSQLDH